MDEKKIEQMSLGDISLGYVDILQDIVDELFVKLIEKKIITADEAKELLENSVNRQLKSIERIKENNEIPKETKERLIRIRELAIDVWQVEEESAKK